MENFEKILKEKQNLIDQLILENKQIKQENFELGQKLAESERFKSHFISNVTNELINPVTSLLAFTDLLYKTEENTPFEKIKHFSSQIHNEAIDINFQLKNIFMSASFEAGRFNLDYNQFSLGQILDDVINEFKHLIDRKNLKITINSNFDEKQYPIISDVEKIRLVVSNLLNNAIRYSYENGEIIISLKLEQNKLQFSFRDFGIGIKPQSFEKVFERFYRIDNTINSLNKGSGIGLTVSKQIIELLGGTIYFEHQNQGAEVIFTIKIPETLESNGKSMNGTDVIFDDGLELF